MIQGAGAFRENGFVFGRLSPTQTWRVLKLSHYSPMQR
uniref:Uncharacterized protein n=1 Tax=Anguilla anguilla TaxID=7936 RepID=A0A0E9TC02_ANGAN